MMLYVSPWSFQCVTYAALWGPPHPPLPSPFKIFHYCSMTAWARLVHVTLNIYVVRIQTVVYPALRIFTAVR
jgi:hypothetical protein